MGELISTGNLHREPAINDLEQLGALILQHKDELLANWLAKVRHLSAADHLDRPALTDHIPDFLKELTRALREAPLDVQVSDISLVTAPAHGLQRLEVGFAIEDVVSEYNTLRDCIHDLTDKNGIILTGRPLRVLNCVLDGAIAIAVRSYAMESTLEVQRRREEYLSFIAHDLRTPLNAIELATSLMERSNLDRSNPVLNKAIKSLQRNVQQLAVLTTSILDENVNMQTESGIRLTRRTIDLWPLVEALIHSLNPVAGTNSTNLINDIDEDLVVYADAMLLRRIFQNLLANAINHAPRGEVVISARQIGQDGTVECIVADSGLGISKDKLPYIFDKFETGDESGVGLGLGLTICKAFVEAHGGEITVSSTPDAGTTFRFSLSGKP
jgi:two-component system phosphate regulon sensor histidine kinase PhoR